MNLQDLAKKAIDEVSTQISQKETIESSQKQEQIPQDEPSLTDNKEPERQVDESDVIDLNAYEKEILELIEKKNTKDEVLEIIAKDKQEEYAGLSFNEEMFLKNIRERVLVLFEGLSSSDEKDLRSRLDLTINFLEFLLANIEDKLKK
ncbi:CiaD-like domain-containing protein [Campylobacter sp. MIT 97-5078]|uniref:CiaD-like domain-containing protein n=1 Tax=Campylobacter sp. MIT 97-5078 TaxID=1548153 RepID=UPI0005130564|nr:hypothetical protein [Campylobacter sp. MIT 97-5078]KGI57375.1 hypothetical protein LR59_01240 [Campylobacter sp. MIT 97-5078]TQR27465.1 2-oxoglutarate:acceptor oxidoreductase [Campylobacter sp. MIT 97-5078]